VFIFHPYRTFPEATRVSENWLSQMQIAAKFSSANVICQSDKPRFFVSVHGENFIKEIVMKLRVEVRFNMTSKELEVNKTHL